MSKKRQLLPEDVVIDRFQQAINGSSAGADPDRFGFMSRERATNSIKLMKGAFTTPLKEDDIASSTLRKSVTLATGLTYYDLRAPALNLFPTVTPIRNSLPRNQRPDPGDAAHWKSVDAIVGSGYPYMGWVPEGKRTGSMSYVTSDHTLTYKTIGEEDSITEEARFASEGFEDEDALVQLRLLLKMFVKEEAALLCGNFDVALSAPSTPVVSAAGTGATLPSATYVVYAVALTPEGYLNSSVAGGVATQITITGNDGGTYTLNGGSSNKSAASAGQAITLGQVLSATVAAQQGAAAYAWYCGVSGSEKLEKITTINSVTFSAPLAGTGQAATAITADRSTNTTAFNGLLMTLLKSGSGAALSALATGTAGTGTGLTSSGAGSIVEIDNMFKSQWDVNMISSTVIYLNSQELRNITYKVMNNASAPLLRYASNATDSGTPEYKITAAGVVAFYFNPYTPDGGVKVPLKVHPNIAPGMILSWAEQLPPWYVSNNVPEVATVQTRQDYYAEVWPKTTRVQFYGVYTQEMLAVYATFAGGIIYNIGNV